MNERQSETAQEFSYSFTWINIVEQSLIILNRAMWKKPPHQRFNLTLLKNFVYGYTIKIKVNYPHCLMFALAHAHNGEVIILVLHIVYFIRFIKSNQQRFNLILFEMILNDHTKLCVCIKCVAETQHLRLNYVT